jgi:hypothetical protein
MQLRKNLRKASKALTGTLSITLIGCRSIYLEPHGTVSYVGEKSLTVTVNCKDYKRPDCQVWLTFDREDFPFAYQGQVIYFNNANNE